MKCECGCGRELVLAKRGPASRRTMTVECRRRLEREADPSGCQKRKAMAEAKADAERALSELKVALGW